MQLVDVNVLVYAYREDAPGHAGFRTWLQDTLDSDLAFGVSDLVLSGLVFDRQLLAKGRGALDDPNHRLGL